MKTVIKRMTAFILVLCFVFSAAFVADAASGKWMKSGSRWWYRHADSTFTKNNWEKIGKKWYHFDSSGWMQTGWIKVGKGWYYLDKSGVLQTGWKKISGKWYYLNSDGKMQTGWKKLKGKWYYFESSGIMKTGWLKKNGKKYYFDSAGVMATGEVIIGDDICFFDDNGVLLKTASTKQEIVWYGFASDEKLNQHYQKHGVEMGYKSAMDYQTGANLVINNPNALVKTGSDNDTIYYLESTNEIVFVSEYGKIRTYFVCSGKDYFDKQ